MATPVLGHLDERDVERWRAGDANAMRADLDDALGIGEQPSPLSDAELIEAVRGGTVQAYGSLYARHVHAARNLALQLAKSSADAEDLVSDAFAKVLISLRAGGGPGSAFRPYLLTTVRYTAYDRFRQQRRLELADDLEAVPGVERVTRVPFRDTAVAGLERALITRAFADLPERWQNVLWHTAIENRSPDELASTFGLTPNGVAALAYRAREGLRKAYLQAHVTGEPAERCQAAVGKLGAWTRGGLSRRESIQLNAHLDECAACQAVATELADVNGALRGIVAPIVLGAGAAGYLAATAKASASASAVSAPALLGAAASAVVFAVAVGIGTLGPPPRAGAPATAAAPPASSSTAGTPTTPPPGGASAPISTGATAPATTGQPSGTTPVTTTPVTTNTTAATAPSLVAEGPSGFTMSTGGPPADFPITVRNTGSAPAAPMTVTLTLPDGVKVVGPGNPPAGSIGCPAGSGTVTCTAKQQLPPDASVTFVFRLLAGPKAADGTLTATTGPVRLDIPLTVKGKK
ncbi:sigma-70 family RNA polymerase sigma factor [Amycolatopsis orientalis]|uniref:sigma-70 family RNA polymerase sigma factor n=1 Tax=Amycolatopsis orientalis TaxID=31958 RepID=UPI001269705A|nr:sigma-70 family RNA polymerase sigma factor [Amycolatopsis orientalis]